MNDYPGAIKIMKELQMEDIQNIANLGISSLVSANLVYYSLYGQQLNFSLPFIFAHFMIDFFYCLNSYNLLSCYYKLLKNRL